MEPKKLKALIDERWPGTAVASTLQLARAGIDERVMTAGVRSGMLLRLRRGAYVQRAYWNTLKPWDRDRLLITAHYESTGGQARYSHISAARLHSCYLWNAGPMVHVTTQYANSPGSAGSDVKAHRLPLTDRELTTIRTPDGRDMLTTSLERTVLDCARILPLDQAAVIGDHALRKGASVHAMHRLLSETPAKRGSRRALDLLNVLDGRSESAGETRTRLMLHSFGLQTFTPQVEVPTSEGLFRADFADPESRVIIEFDGTAKYTDYKPAEEVLLAERRRENALVETGWRVLRLHWKHLDRPRELNERLITFLDRTPGMQKRP
ncbi:type IV toxin-antitoxin system AbiEi family antitoxin domain-containing protein [Arthrobacter sp. P2b]|uniref:type IV toxin-antitoxin system AbiEi family antitoxin domain-containing protein n=1 Tax=Arthrobacter sp. P2b TaxID=1938741 RepID=UPI0009A7A7EA|nr:type IV toxin-antitoxin system AbiEi family antitoxin domain-containing protein [Arthrobacter sp. P2b]SLK01075.1 Transcriptional regulator, AbiEi antitoxin, Type IV TA system [Arthrobacter sp. P2b]